MKVSKSLLMVIVLLSANATYGEVCEGLKTTDSQTEIKHLNKQVERTLASSGVKSVYHYMDMECEKLMKGQTDDEFLKFARKEIRFSIGEHFCELVQDDPAFQADLEYEAQRDYISRAGYSKLIDSLYSTYHFEQR